MKERYLRQTERREADGYAYEYVSCAPEDAEAIKAEYVSEGWSLSGEAPLVPRSDRPEEKPWWILLSFKRPVGG